MNADQIARCASWMLNEEEQYSIQQIMQNIVTNLRNMISQPQQVQHQQSLVNTVAQLYNSLSKIRALYDISEWRSLERIGATAYFSISVYNRVKNIIDENAMTPGVAASEIDALIGARSTYITSLKNLKNGLEEVGITGDDVEEPEVGFQIPRDLFNNNLDGLLVELRAIRRILRSASEIATGSVEDIQVRNISTSDPTFFFGLDPATVLAIGSLVAWSIDKWKQIEDIRKVRAETKKLSSFSKEEVEQIFDKKIKDTIQKDIEAKVAELVGPSGSTGRKAEQRTDLSWALEAMLARIERGMIVEIRIPPLPSDDVEDDQGNSSTDKYSELREIGNKIEFPMVEASPVLNLPVMPSDSDQPVAKSRKKQQETEG